MSHGVGVSSGAPVNGIDESDWPTFSTFSKWRLGGHCQIWLPKVFLRTTSRLVSSVLPSQIKGTLHPGASGRRDPNDRRGQGTGDLGFRCDRRLVLAGHRR
jgi:hypothetical protein